MVFSMYNLRIWGECIVAEGVGNFMEFVEVRPGELFIEINHPWGLGVCIGICGFNREVWDEISAVLW